MDNRPILIVEDEVDGQELIARMLKQVQVNTDIAGTAEDAWALLQENEYTGAIIDLALPGQDGLQLIAAIRENSQFKGLPCIAVTAYHTPELRQKTLDAGFDAYFPKPINRALFLGAVDELFSSKS